MSERELPRAGEVWKWQWVWADIIKAGPKRVTYWNGEARISSPTDRFLSRYHRVFVTRPAPPVTVPEPEGGDEG